MYQSKINISGEFYEANSAKSVSCELTLIAGKIALCKDGNPVVSDLEIKDTQGNKIVFFTCGRQFCAYNDFDPKKLGATHSSLDQLFDYFSVFSIRKFLYLSFLLLATLFCLRYLFFESSFIFAKIIPSSFEEKIGDTIYLGFKDSLDLKHSDLSFSKKQQIRDGLVSISLSAGLSPTPAIKFHNSDEIGSNALAFPGGPILLTDSLVEMLTRDELIAVLAHEVAHIKNKHLLQQLIRVAGLSIISSLIFSDELALIGDFSDLGVVALMLKSNRDFEKESDLDALEYLDDIGVDKHNLFLALRKILRCSKNDTPVAKLDNCQNESSFSWLSTHPSPNERLEYLGDFD